MSRNSITNLSYFQKRLKDNGFIVWKIFNKYNEMDSRLWTVLINPGAESVYITCRSRKGASALHVPEFHIVHDYMNLQDNVKIRTASIEVLVNHLLKCGVTNDCTIYKKIAEDQVNV